MREYARQRPGPLLCRERGLPPPPESVRPMITRGGVTSLPRLVTPDERHTDTHTTKQHSWNSLSNTNPDPADQTGCAAARSAYAKALSTSPDVPQQSRVSRPSSEPFLTTQSLSLPPSPMMDDIHADLSAAFFFAPLLYIIGALEWLARWTAALRACILDILLPTAR